MAELSSVKAAVCARQHGGCRACVVSQTRIQTALAKQSSLQLPISKSQLFHNDELGAMIGS
jgi:hypothetical protein